MIQDFTETGLPWRWTGENYDLTFEISRFFSTDLGDNCIVF